MSATIRSAVPGDVDELTRLRWEFRLEAGTPSSLTRAAFEDEMRPFTREALAERSPWRVWVAEDAGRIVGCVWLQLVERVPHPDLPRWARPIAYLTNMYVEPERRDDGLGRRLLDVALAFAHEREVDGVILWPSARSVPFYERAGFCSDPAPLWLEVAGD